MGLRCQSPVLFILSVHCCTKNVIGLVKKEDYWLINNTLNVIFISKDMSPVIISNVTVCFQHDFSLPPFLSFPLCSPFHLSMLFHPSLCSPSTTSSPTEVNRQWATSKGLFALDILFGEQENNYSYSSALGTHKKRMLPKNRKERKRGQNKKGAQARQKERERKPQYPAMTWPWPQPNSMGYLGCVE